MHFSSVALGGHWLVEQASLIHHLNHGDEDATAEEVNLPPLHDHEGGEVVEAGGLAGPTTTREAQKATASTSAALP